MVIFVAAFMLLCLYKVNFNFKKGSFFDDYMSVQKTLPIKGIFILIVFFSHFNSYVDFTLKSDSIYAWAVKTIGQWMVTLFMFYSGYGVMEQIKKKGRGYISSIPTKRVSNLLFKFDTAVLIFVLIKLILGEKIRLGKLALSFIGWESMGNSNWYIFDILLLYVVSYFAFCLIRDEKKYIYGAFGVFVFCLCYIVFLMKTGIKDYWWYDTALCYPLGMLWSLKRDKIEGLIAKNPLVYAFTVSVLLALSLVTKKYDGNGIINIASMIVFTFFVVAVTMRVSIGNKALSWCGKYLFEIYILQRIPMKLLKSFGIAQDNIYIFFILCLVITLILAVVFSRVTDIIWKKLTASKKA